MSKVLHFVFILAIFTSLVFYSFFNTPPVLAQLNIKECSAAGYQVYTTPPNSGAPTAPKTGEEYWVNIVSSDIKAGNNYYVEIVKEGPGGRFDWKNSKAGGDGGLTIENFRKIPELGTYRVAVYYGSNIRNTPICQSSPFRVDPIDEESGGGLRPTAGESCTVNATIANQSTVNISASGTQRSGSYIVTIKRRDTGMQQNLGAANGSNFINVDSSGNATGVFQIPANYLGGETTIEIMHNPDSTIRCSSTLSLPDTRINQSPKNPAVGGGIPCDPKTGQVFKSPSRSTVPGEVVKRPGQVPTTADPPGQTVSRPGGIQTPQVNPPGQTVSRPGTPTDQRSQADLYQDQLNALPKGVMTAIGCVPTEPKEFVVGMMKFISFGAGGIAMILMILGALQMITAEGNPENLNHAREKFYSAIIGLLFIIFSVLLLQVIGYDILGLPGFNR